MHPEAKNRESHHILYPGQPPGGLIRERSREGQRGAQPSSNVDSLCSPHPHLRLALITQHLDVHFVSTPGPRPHLLPDAHRASSMQGPSQHGPSPWNGVRADLTQHLKDSSKGASKVQARRAPDLFSLSQFRPSLPPPVTLLLQSSSWSPFLHYLSPPEHPRHGRFIFLCSDSELGMQEISVI